MATIERYSGILLHPTSLPGYECIGTFGRSAFDFIDFLYDAGQSLWQTLPLGPTGAGNSPYQCFSAFAINPYLIDLEDLVERGWLNHDDIRVMENDGSAKVDYGRVVEYKPGILKKAFRTAMDSAGGDLMENLGVFKLENSYWLEDYARFMAFKSLFGGQSWNEWPHDLKFREPHALDRFVAENAEEILFHEFIQFVAFSQWNNLKAYANSLNILLIGDIPLYVSGDSADVWANPNLFLMNDELEPVYVAGVPPDYFSETGQLWGNPVYNWDMHKASGFDWWLKRIRINMAVSDMIRIDHFRGLAEYWAVPAGDTTAVNGQWLPAAGREMLTAILDNFHALPIIAEDLGVITPDVEALRDDFKLPGMKILQFAFDRNFTNQFLPHYHSYNSVVYTGTHDNDTVLGWHGTLSEENRDQLLDYLGCTQNDLHWQMIRMAMASVSKFSLIPIQDVLGLGTEARMNVPGTADYNWEWRMQDGALDYEHEEKLYVLSVMYGRRLITHEDDPADDGLFTDETPAERI